MTDAATMTAAETAPDVRAADLDALRAYVRTLADRMGLKGWTFDVDDHIKGGHRFRIEWFEDGRDATFAAADSFFDLSPERRRSLVVGELLACHFRRAAVLFADRDLVDDDLDVAVFEGIQSAAAAWAPALPLPLVGLMKRAER